MSGSVTATGVGAGAVGVLGVLGFGATSPALVSVTVPAVGAIVAAGMAADKVVRTDAPTTADHVEEDFTESIFKWNLSNQQKHESSWLTSCSSKVYISLSNHTHYDWWKRNYTTRIWHFFKHFIHLVESIIKMFWWAPSLPVGSDNFMLTILLLLSKYRLRNAPVVEAGKPFVKDFIIQSAIVKGLQECKGRDWLDCISAHPLSDLGLPFMPYDGVMFVRSD